MGDRECEVMRPAMLARMRSIRGFASFPRCNVRVFLGRKEVLCVFFNADTLQETRAAERVRVTLRKCHDARVLVSQRCHGELAGYPVVGEPMAQLDDTFDDNIAAVSEGGEWVLRRLKKLGTSVFFGRHAQAVKPLVALGYIVRNGDELSITAAGLAVLGMLDKEVGK
jgi:hypothetical protein